MDSEEDGFVGVLDLIQEYLELQKDIGEALQNGYLHIARSRYQSGPNSASSLQIPKRLSATAGVRVEDDGSMSLIREPDSSECIKIVSARPDDTGDSLKYSEEKPSQEVATVLHTHDAGKEQSLIEELAARFACQSLDGGGTTDGPFNGTDDLEHRKSRQEDPLRWFGGALAPHDIRQAQQSFLEALGTMIKAASLQLQIRNAYQDVQFDK